jgi:hypothetical protein
LVNIVLAANSRVVRVLLLWSRPLPLSLTEERPVARLEHSDWDDGWSGTVTDEHVFCTCGWIEPIDPELGIDHYLNRWGLHADTEHPRS